MPDHDTPPPLPLPTGARRRTLCVLAGVVGAAMFFAKFPPSVWPIWPKCVLHDATGWHCPGCGLTRAISALLRGDPVAAFRHHPVFWLLAAPVAVWQACRAAYAIRHNRFPSWGLKTAWLSVGAIVFVAAGVLRNLPGCEFLGP